MNWMRSTHDWHGRSSCLGTKNIAKINFSVIYIFGMDGWISFSFLLFLFKYTVSLSFANCWAQPPHQRCVHFNWIDSQSSSSPPSSSVLCVCVSRRRHLHSMACIEHIWNVYSYAYMLVYVSILCAMLLFLSIILTRLSLFPSFTFLLPFLVAETVDCKNENKNTKHNNNSSKFIWNWLINSV